MNPKLEELYMSNHVQALAYYRADSDNKARILSAWPDLFEKYRRIAVELRELEIGD